MRLQSECTPDPHDGVLSETGLGGHQPSTPMRAVGGHRFQRLGHDLFNSLIANLAGGANSRLIQQTIYPRLPKPLPPFAHSCAGNTQFLSDLGVAQAARAVEHNASTHRQGLGGLWSPRYRSQLLAVVITDLESFLGPAGSHTQVCARPLIYSTYFSLRTLAFTKAPERNRHNNVHYHRYSFAFLRVVPSQLARWRKRF